MLTEIVISLVPLFPSYLALKMFRRTDGPSAKWKSALFYVGLFGSLIASLLIIGSWLQPFPLSYVHGVYSNRRNDVLSFTAFAAAILVMVLSVFGSAYGRLLSLLSGLLLLILSIAAFISNNR